MYFVLSAGMVCDSLHVTVRRISALCLLSVW